MGPEKNFKRGEKKMMKAEFDRMILEATGRTGDEAVLVRCYRRAPLRMEWAYGADGATAQGNLERNARVIEMGDFEQEQEGK